MADDPRTTEALTGATALRATVKECQLSFIAGPRRGHVHKFAHERLVIGADERADVVVDDRAMSKFHCEIRTKDGIWFVRDLGSRNGTHVDGVPVLEAPLRSGSRLRLGRSELQFGVGSRDVALDLSTKTSFGRLRGSSISMRRVYRLLEAAARVSTTVLLQGETGTGKDCAAEAIHLESDRRDAPFVVVDCGALPPSLAETELFGHEAGAFTGATEARRGAFELANGGTLFLDEVGELAPAVQPKLLRVLAERQVQRIGGSERRAVNVRVIAATNRELKAEVNAKRFRSDLYFRLAVLVITLPPVRERRPDIPELVSVLLDDLRAGDSPLTQSLKHGELSAELLRHSWPGNVRELRNYLESTLARGELPPHAETAGAPAIDTSLPLRSVRDQWVRHVEREYLSRLLAEHDNNVSAAARTAGVDRVHLHRLLRRVGLR